MPRRHANDLQVGTADRALASSSVVAVDLVDPNGLAVRAAELAACQRSPETRRTYASVYRALVGFLGVDARPADLTPNAVRRYRDHMEQAGKSPATVAKHLSAVRLLAGELDADPAIRTVRSERVSPGEPRALDPGELERILLMPDRRTTKGLRDLAILHLLAGAGLRRAEVANLRANALIERRRHRDPRLRNAVADSTTYALKIRGKRGRERTIPLPHHVVDALRTWHAHRPPATTDRFLTTLPAVAGRDPGALDPRDISRIAERHAKKAGLPENKRGAHVLRHTFATHLRDRNVPIDVIRDLLGHADIRTTQIYSRVAQDQLEAAIDDVADADTVIGRR